MTDLAWIDATLTSARPQAMGALLRYFRDLDAAEEAFQDACLRALQNWPKNGPPRDPAAWLILVGRNVALDGIRRRSRHTALPDEETISDLEDAEGDLAERLDGSHYRDDVLRLLFICCHSELPATQQIALALRIVSGLSVKQIARAFLVGDSAMEQRITRAKARIAAASPVPFEAPGAPERAERLSAVAAMIYLVFNEGYSAGAAADPRASLCEEAIRLARLLLRLFPAEPEMMGLTALLLLQHSRFVARFAADGSIILLEDQDRRLWDGGAIAEGLALIDKAMRHRRPGPYQVQAAIAALHARARQAADTGWAEIDLLYATLERLQPSPVVTLNRSVAVSKARGSAEALAMIEPLEPRLSGYFHFFGAKGAYLLQLGRTAEARIAFDRAIALANTAAEAAHIRTHIDRLIRESAPKHAPEPRAETAIFLPPLSEHLPIVLPRPTPDDDGSVPPAEPVETRQLIVARSFDASPEAVYAAWTDPEQVRHFWGPKGMTTPVCEMDLRPGGIFRTVMRAPNGGEYPTAGTFLELTPPHRLVFTDAYGGGWTPSPRPFMTVVLTIEAVVGGCRLTVRAVHWSAADREAHERMGFHAGWGESLDRLADHLAGVGEASAAMRHGNQ